MTIKVSKKVLFYYITLVAKNGEPRLVSETYFSKSNAVRAARSLAKDIKAKVEVK